MTNLRGNFTPPRRSAASAPVSSRRVTLLESPQDEEATDTRRPAVRGRFTGPDLAGRLPLGSATVGPLADDGPVTSPVRGEAGEESLA